MIKNRRNPVWVKRLCCDKAGEGGWPMKDPTLWNRNRNDRTLKAKRAAQVHVGVFRHAGCPMTEVLMTASIPCWTAKTADGKS
jgi:hypothetical protein